MESFDSIRKLRNVKRYNTITDTTLSENSCSEDNPVVNSHETNENESPETRAFTQEEVNEKIKTFIAPFTRQLEDLTRIVQ